MVGALDDLPCRSLNELLATLTQLHDQGVSLLVASADIDSLASPAHCFLNLMAEFRRLKKSRAIQKGQAKAIVAGKRIGRPMVPLRLRQRIADAVAAGRGIRPTAREFGVSAGTVINVCRIIGAARAA